MSENKDRADLSADRLREMLDYDPLTGIFRWKKRQRNNTCNVGQVAGTTPNNQGYCRVALDGRQYRAHRLAWLHVYGEWPAQDIDHIDRNRANNAIANLRDVSNRRNSWNTGTRSTNKTGLAGTYGPTRYSKYIAQISHAGRRIYLGTFETPQEAHAAYCEAVARHRGAAVAQEFACALRAPINQGGKDD
jgi:hypothetical protein